MKEHLNNSMVHGNRPVDLKSIGISIEKGQYELKMVHENNFS